MRISNGTIEGDLSETNGYGYATRNMLDSLARLGYEVNDNDPTADVEIWFDQPPVWEFSEGPYKIGYHPWESTKLPTPNLKISSKLDWAERMNLCDEIWTPSELIADWYRRFAGIKVPVYVYEHGVDPIWSPEKRHVDDMFKFLHVGGDAARKGCKEVMDAYRVEFPDRRGKDVELNLKMINDGWRIPQLRGINVMTEEVGLEELIEIFHANHAFVYPSWGEGFGLSPLQALATGMPTITVPEWAPYRKFIHPDLAIPSRLAKTPWPAIHPGLMLKPDVQAVQRAMVAVVDRYDEFVDWHLEQAPRVTEEYSWDRLTEEAFGNLETRLKNL
jgi:glycosyltransferase involved in cell wall biosynthesis